MTRGERGRLDRLSRRHRASRVALLAGQRHRRPWTGTAASRSIPPMVRRSERALPLRRHLRARGRGPGSSPAASTSALALGGPERPQSGGGASSPPRLRAAGAGARPSVRRSEHLAVLASGRSSRLAPLVRAARSSRALPRAPECASPRAGAGAWSSAPPEQRRALRAAGARGLALRTAGVRAWALRVPERASGLGPPERAPAPRLALRGGHALGFSSSPASGTLVRSGSCLVRSFP